MSTLGLSFSLIAVGFGFLVLCIHQFQELKPSLWAGMTSTLFFAVALYLFAYSLEHPPSVVIHEQHECVR